MTPRPAPIALRIRPAQEADAGGIAAVHMRSWQTAYRGILPDDFLDTLSIPQREERMRELLATKRSARRVWVIESEEGLLGFSEAGPSREDEAPDWAAEVYTIYLDPTAVGKGIGRELFAHTVADLRNAGYRHATLWALERNERARRFYEKAGWRPDGTSSIWERFNINALRYRLDFQRDADEH
jgi:L-amino acid N-acyltransferase YncA